MNVLLPTTKRFYYCELGPFFTLWEKFWPGQKVTVLGDAEPDILGDKRFPDMDYFDMPGRFRINNMWIMHHWSGGLRWYLKEHVEDEVVFMIQTDHWLTAPVDVEAVERAKRFMEANDDVVRVSLCVWPKSSAIEPLDEFEGMEFWGCPKGDACFAILSNQPALWKKDLLLDVWEDGWDGWATEIHGVNRMLAQFPTYRSLVVRPPAMQWVHICYTRGDKYWRLSQIPKELADEVRPWMPQGFTEG